MRKRPGPDPDGHDHAPHGEANRGAPSAATVEDLARVQQLLAEAERIRGEAVVTLARVRARGDGEAACGMPVEQHLRWTTNLRRGAISTMAVVTDVADELPTVLAALEAGEVTLDQVAAIAWPAARVSADLRRSLDLSLAEHDGWTRLDPDALESEVGRLLESLADPAQVERREARRRDRRFLHLQPELDGRALRFWGRAVGVDAALLDASLRAAADAPVADDGRDPDDPDGDGVIVRDRARGRQLHDGLLRILREWGAGHGRGVADATADGGDTRDAHATPDTRSAGPDLTLYAIVDERDEAPAPVVEVLTTVRGLAPRLTPLEIARLAAIGRVRRVEVRADAHGDLVSVASRAGHLHHDPTDLSEDTSRILCLVRDATCRAPGCDRPVLDADLHHLRWRSWASPDDPVRDDPTNRALVCRRCHHRVVHRWRWTATVGRAGRITWRRDGAGTQGGAPPRVATSRQPTPSRQPATTGRLARRLPLPTGARPPAPANRRRPA